MGLGQFGEAQSVELAALLTTTVYQISALARSEIARSAVVCLISLFARVDRGLFVDRLSVCKGGSLVPTPPPKVIEPRGPLGVRKLCGILKVWLLQKLSDNFQNFNP